ncbi:hypothetical protein T08_6882 [Trichinella sp. T8]|nr:hypothetical protein T08_6882 [Trichinella sp. T8]
MGTVPDRTAPTSVCKAWSGQEYCGPTEACSEDHYRDNPTTAVGVEEPPCCAKDQLRSGGSNEATKVRRRGLPMRTSQPTEMFYLRFTLDTRRAANSRALYMYLFRWQRSERQKRCASSTVRALRLVNRASNLSISIDRAPFVGTGIVLTGAVIS